MCSVIGLAWVVESTFLSRNSSVCQKGITHLTVNNKRHTFGQFKSIMVNDTSSNPSLFTQHITNVCLFSTNLVTSVEMHIIGYYITGLEYNII